MNSASEKAERGRRWGWIGGGIGSLLWLLPMGVLALSRGETLAAFITGATLISGLAYLFIFAPWRYPHVAFARFYLGLAAIVIGSAAVLLWLMAVPLLGAGRSYMMLLPLVTLFIPVFIFGRRRWDELGPVLMRRDDGCSR